MNEEAAMNEVRMEGAAGKQKKGMGLYTLIAVLILVIGLVFTFSISCELPPKG